MMNVESSIAATGILPVIAIPSVDAAVPLADALAKGGLNAITVCSPT